ncbi:complex I NDUFA9 subunit family protein [Pseudomonadota bacterium]
MTPKTICVLGGTGFVGHHLISQLTKAGYYVVAPSRNRERRRSLMVLPKVDVIDADIHDEETLKALFVGCHAVINLAAILNENKKGDFQKIHVELVKKVTNACKEAGVERLLHMSALNADAVKGTSGYLRTKGEGEDLAHNAEGLKVTSFCPSVIFGADDKFFNKFAFLLLNLPVLPLACADARIAPVFVADVADAMVKSINDKETYGERYELCGPDVINMKQAADYVNRLTGLHRSVIPLGNGLSGIQARIMGLMPFKPFTYDNYLSLQTPSVSDKPFPERFGIHPTPMETVVPKYIGREDLRGRFDGMRQNAARDSFEP